MFLTNEEFLSHLKNHGPQAVEQGSALEKFRVAT